MKKIVSVIFLFSFCITNALDRPFDFVNDGIPKNNSVLLIFYRDDCPYCQNMSSVFKNEPAFTTLLSKNFSIRKIDVKTEEGRLLAEKFNVHAVPSFITYNTKTNNFQSIKGFSGVNKLAVALKLNYSTTPDLHEGHFACGNGIVEAGEVCDDGNLVNGDGCDNNCTPSACGNGIVGGAEACDDGNLNNGDGCDYNCTISVCGNGIVGGTEACDDGNFINGDGCDYNCTYSACGNGIVGGVETCDDGNFTNGDGCDNNCRITGCGNGIVTAGETCDDGNSANGDGCDNNCKITSCGNGIITAGEACDDGNTVSGDGCSSICVLEIAGVNGVAINSDGTQPDPSAVLDVKATNKGVLIPRMTSVQRNSIESPQKGLLVFDSTSNSFWYYKNLALGWVEIGGNLNTGFKAFNNTSQFFASSFNPVFSGEQYDDGNTFASNVFTTQADGVYDLNALATFTLTSVATQTTLILIIENSSVGTEYGSNSLIIPAGFSGTVKLQAAANSKLPPSTTARVRILVNGSMGTQNLSSITFSGFRVY